MVKWEPKNKEPPSSGEERVIPTIGLCQLPSLAVTKHHGQKQLKEERADFGLRFQWNAVLHGRKGRAWGKTRKLADLVSVCTQEVAVGCGGGGGGGMGGLVRSWGGLG